MEVESNATSSLKKTQSEIYSEINLDASLASDVGVNVSGQYELCAVLTHVGRNADSGHYIGWVKSEDGKNWCKLLVVFGYFYYLIWYLLSFRFYCILNFILFIYLLIYFIVFFDLKGNLMMIRYHL